MKRTLALTIAMAGSIAAAVAQTPNLQQQAPNMPMPKDMPAEKIEPQEPSSTGSTGSLSDKLERTDGVIRPPNTSAPDMRVPAPVPDPGTTRVIPPPGSPGGNPNVEPK
jgi:hypothetical protein